MLGIVSAKGSRLNAGSVGLALAQRWGKVGQRVLFIDANTSGPSLAERFGSAVHSVYSPAERGLPSLIAAREPLTLKLVADHSYSLDGAGGSRWALFAPAHPVGAKHAVGWLSDRVNELKEIGRERAVVVGTSLQDGDESLMPLLRAMSVLVVLASASTREEVEALRLEWESSGLLDDVQGHSRQQRVLVINGDSTVLGDNEVMGLSGLYVVGRLPFVDDDKLLRLQVSRKDRSFMRELDKVSDYLLRLSRLDAVEAQDVSPVVLSPANGGTASENHRGANGAVKGALDVPGRRFSPIATEGGV